MKTANYYACSEVNQRENNEDYYKVFPLGYAVGELPITILVVADGMGGHEHGEDVSYQAVLKVEDFLTKAIKEQPITKETLQKILFNALESASKLVKQMTKVNNWKRAGSTMVLAAIWQDTLIAANLGDSPLFHYVAHSGELIKVTQDHSIVAILVQGGLITEEMAQHHERRGQLEFFVGADTLPSPPPVYERTLAPRDLLLLCSDGVSGLLSLAEIQAILKDEATTLEEKGHNLLEKAKNKGETDNQTLILWQQPDSLPSSSSQSLSALASVPSPPLATVPDPEVKELGENSDSDEQNNPSSLVPSQSSRSRRRRKPSPRRLKKRLLLPLLGVAGLMAIALTLVSLDVLPQLFRRVGLPASESRCSQMLPQQRDFNGLIIECFQDNGSVMVTRNRNDNSQQVWQRQESYSCNNLSFQEPISQQRLWRIHQSRGTIFTRDPSGCKIRWTLQTSPESNSPKEPQFRNKQEAIKTIHLYLTSSNESQ